MRALYNTCWLDPWIDVAKVLQNNYGVKPCYWIGYYDDNSEVSVPAEFADIVYQSRWDAWKGVFCNVIEKEYTNYPLDIDWLKRIAEYELQAIAAMDRMDPDRASFPFAERQRLFRNMLRKWFAVFDQFKISIIYADRIPHRSYDLALYWVAREAGIKYIFLQPTSLKYRSITQESIFRINELYIIDYQGIKSNYENLSLEDTKKLINKDIYNQYLLKKKDYNNAIPDYMLMHAEKHKKNSNILKLGLNFLLEFTNIKKNKEVHIRRNKSFLKDFLNIHPYAKKRGVPIEDSKYNAIEYGFVVYKALRYKKKLKDYYEEHTLPLDLAKPYIFFALHYQPEATSNPAGDIFTDQYLAIEQLANIVPEGWQIYVKEHKSQFVAINEGQKARFLHLYKDLLKISNVRLVSIETNSFDLIDQAKAVATITGTVGWEAIVREKPVIVFGLTWYEACYGVKRIYGKRDIDGLIDFVCNYRPQEKMVLLYLFMMQNNALPAYSYKAMGKGIIDDKVCLSNIVRQLTQN